MPVDGVVELRREDVRVKKEKLPTDAKKWRVLMDGRLVVAKKRSWKDEKRGRGKKIRFQWRGHDQCHRRSFLKIGRG